MRRFRLISILFVLAVTACGGSEQPTVSPTPTESPTPEPFDPSRGEVITFDSRDGTQLSGTIFGEGRVAVVLAHQGTTGADQTTWQPFAQLLAANGFTVLTFDFRGRGQSEGYLYQPYLIHDLNAAIGVLRERGYDEIICAGASMGGTSCLRAALDQDLSGLVVLASPLDIGGDTSVRASELPELDIPKLFITTAYDYGQVVTDIAEMFAGSSAPKQLQMYPGTTHGTDIFYTAEGEAMESLLYGFFDDVRGGGNGIFKQVVELTGTLGPIYSLDWSIDGSMLATAGHGQIKIWDSDTLQERVALAGHEGFIWDVSWSPDGRYLGSGGQDGVRLWDATSLENVATLDTGWAFSLAWSPDSRLLAVGKAYGGVEIWDVESRSEVTTLPAESMVISLSWSSEGTRLAAGLLDGEILVWDTGDWALLQTLIARRTARSDANGLAWSPDGQLLASAHQDGRVRVWDVANGRAIRSMSGHTGWVRGIAWSPDGLRLASSGEDGSVRIWDLELRGQASAYAVGEMPLWSVAWSPDGGQIAAGSGVYDVADCQSSIWLWDPP